MASFWPKNHVDLGQICIRLGWLRSTCHFEYHQPFLDTLLDGRPSTCHYCIKPFFLFFFFFQPILPVRNSFSQEKEKEGFRVKNCRERFLACERVLRNPMMRLFARSRNLHNAQNYRSINSKYVRSWNGWVTVPPCVSREKSCIMTTCNTCPRFNKILFTGRKEGRKEKSSFFQKISFANKIHIGLQI